MEWINKRLEQSLKEGFSGWTKVIPWVNLNEARFFVKLSINPEEQLRTPRLVFVVSLHHVGQQLTGIMATTAFAQIRDFREPDSEESQEFTGLYFRDCTVEPVHFHLAR